MGAGSLPRQLGLGLAALVLGCAPVLDVDDDDTDVEDATPPPDVSVGCDPLSLTQEQVCDDDRNASGFETGTTFCPEFWDSLDLGEGWSTLSSRWTLDFEAVAPSLPYDHWEYRNIQGDPLTAALPVDVIASVGTPCATATDPAGCEASLDALRPVEGFVGGCGPMGCSADYLATSLGDAVSAVTDADSMAAFVGALDGPVEALLLASAALDGFGWSSGTLEGGAIRATDDAYEILGSVPVWTSPHRSDAVLVSVSLTGTVQIVDRALQELDCSVQL